MKLSPKKLFIISFCFFLVLDFISKAAVDAWIPLLHTVPPIYPYGGVGVFENLFGIQFSIVHTTNTGAAFSMFSNYPDILILGRILITGGLFVWLFFFNQNEKYFLPFSLILAGAVGNLVDAFLYGHVVDMLSWIFWGYRFAIFNIADSCITVGIAWLIILNLSSKEAEAPNKCL